MKTKARLAILTVLSLLFISAQAKDTTIVFNAANDYFSNIDTETSASQITKSHVTITAYSGNWNQDHDLTNYRWYYDKVLSFSSPCKITKIVFSREGLKSGENSGANCKQIKLEDDYKNIGSLTYSSSNKLATWKLDDGINRVDFRNSKDALWLTSISVTITLPDLIIDGSSASAVNSSMINAEDGKTKLSVMLKRKFVADGGWYTLCLPFYRSWKQMRETFGDEVEVCEFTSAEEREDGTLSITFSPVTGEYPIVNGTPYLIRPSKSTDAEIMFSNVNMHDVAPKTIEHAGVRLIGVYDPFEMPCNDTQYRFLVGSDGLTLDYNNVEGGKIKGTRAYFVLPSAETTVANRVALADPGPTKTAAIPATARQNDDACHTITGIRLTKMPSQKGIYILNGRKISIR